MSQVKRHTVYALRLRGSGGSLPASAAEPEVVTQPGIRDLAVIRCGGESWSPFEIDEALRCHPAVVELLSFPIAHREFGQAAAVLVVFSTSGEQTTLSELRTFGQRTLASHHLPVAMVVATSMPAEARGEDSRASLSERLALPEWPCEQTTWALGDAAPGATALLRPVRQPFGDAAAPTALRRPVGPRCVSAQSAMQTVGELAREAMRRADVLSVDVPLMDAGMDSLMIPTFTQVRTLRLRSTRRARSV